jgi:hypothetical protein
MEATLGIFLYSYLYLKLAKTIRLSYFLLCFLVNKLGAQEGGKGLEGWGGEASGTMYTHGSKCKNDKRRKKKKKQKTQTLLAPFGGVLILGG